MIIKTELWEHQRNAKAVALKSLAERGVFWLLAGCATGKTLTMLSVIAALQVNRVLVITTKSAMNSSWGEDVKAHTEGLNCVILDKGDSVDKGNALYRKYSMPTVFVLNYETASIIWRDIYEAGFDMVICDESQRIKTYNSGVSINLAKACWRVKYKIAMTGTPWDDRPTDVYGQVRWLMPELLRRGHPRSKVFGSWGDFFEEYVIYYQLGHGVKVPKAYKKLGKLTRIIAPFTMKIDSEEVLDLPPEMDIVRHFEMPAKMERLYKSLEEHYIAEGVTVDNALVLGLRLHQLTCGNFDGERIDSTKATEVLAILEEIGGQPAVIFTTFEDDVKYLSDLLTSKGYSVKLLIGGTHEHEAWQKGEGDILIANIAAGSEGVNLTRARYCIYYSLGFSRTQYNQSRYRIRRPGSDKTLPITYYHLIMRNSIDETIREALKDKGDVAEVIYRGIVRG